MIGVQFPQSAVYNAEQQAVWPGSLNHCASHEEVRIMLTHHFLKRAQQIRNCGWNGFSIIGLRPMWNPKSNLSCCRSQWRFICVPLTPHIWFPLSSLFSKYSEPRTSTFGRGELVVRLPAHLCYRVQSTIRSFFARLCDVQTCVFLF